MAKDKDEKDPRQEARDAELARQEKVAKAIHDATHDKDGNPIPITQPGALA